MAAMTAPTLAQSTGGTCTWLLRLPNGAYVYDPTCGGASTGSGFSLFTAHVWLSEERASAAAVGWMSGAKAERARP